MWSCNGFLEPDEIFQAVYHAAELAAHLNPDTENDNDQQTLVIVAPLTYDIDRDLFDAIVGVECRPTVPLDNAGRFAQEAHVCNVLHDTKKMDAQETDKLGCCLSSESSAFQSYSRS